MAKTNVPTSTKDNSEALNEIRETLKNIRKFSVLKDSIFATLKTSKKEMLQKEVVNLTELVNKL